MQGGGGGGTYRRWGYKNTSVGSVGYRWWNECVSLGGIWDWLLMKKEGGGEGGEYV